VLYVHAAVFTGWLLFFALQSALVRVRNVHWHRRIGWFGAAMGIAIIVLGVFTAITMARFNALQLHRSHADSDLMIPLFGMVCFATTLDWPSIGGRSPSFTGGLS
jgi:uncharacterized membrane protein